MPHNKASRKKEARKKNPRNDVVARMRNSTSQSYRGPLTPPGWINANQVVVARQTFIVSAASDPGGVLNMQFTNDPTTSLDWSNWSSLFSEYRVLGMECRWQPRDHNFSGVSPPSVQRTLITYVGRGFPTVSPSSANAAWDNDGARVANTDTPRTVRCYMNGQDDAVWQSFASTRAQPYSYYIGFYATALNQSTVYADIYITWLCQFRGRD